MCVRILAGQSLEPGEEGLNIDTKTIIQNLYPDGHRDEHSQYSTNESDEESVQHKCVGAAREKTPPGILRKCRDKLHKERASIIVRLRPEHTNEKDRNAIAIDMNYGTGWNCFGYIARELTEYIHPLINNRKILSVPVEHIIPRLYWAKIGYYPLINITRKGQWENMLCVDVAVHVKQTHDCSHVSIMRLIASRLKTVDV